MSRKIVILKGSPRGKGNSAALADRLAAGAMEAGAQVESVYLHGMDIRPCDACDLCREQRQGCVIQDDMHSLYPKYLPQTPSSSPARSIGSPSVPNLNCA